MKRPVAMNSKKPAMSGYIDRSFGTDVIRLENGLCPFLSESGLCHIVSEYGDEYTPKTCRQYPREPHLFQGRVEHNLNLGCPAVIDLLLGQEAFGLVMKQDDSVKIAACEPEIDQIYFDIREYFIGVLERKDIPIGRALGMIYFMALELLELEEESPEDMADNFSLYRKSMSIYDMSAGIARVMAEADPVEQFAERNELMLDIMENYRQQGIYLEIIEPIAQRAEEYESKGYETIDNTLIRKIADIEKELETDLRKVFLNELYAGLVLPGTTTMEELVVKLQWIGLQYAVLIQSVSLCPDERDTEETFKRCLMVIIRMTGYTEDSIVEYLENSFEELIWPWNYFGLIV